MKWLDRMLGRGAPGEEELSAARRVSWRHRAQVEAAPRCGCFYCLAVFAPGEIGKWVDEGDTAVCPRCGIDSVIPEAAGISLRPALLQAMRRRWFDGC